MPALVVSHTLNSDHWLQSWTESGPDSRREMFKGAGVTSVRLFQSPQEPSHTGLILEVEDMERFFAFSADEASVQKMAEHDIDFESVRILTEIDMPDTV